MGRRLKIKIVAGNLLDPALLKVWEELSAVHSVEVCGIDSGAYSGTSSLPMVLFPQIPDMPGFCRDLHRHLLGADVIIGIETSKLYTFQALRAARKLGIPFACVTHDYDPFVYEKFTNIRAIQQDICQNSDLFFPTSRRAAQLLEMERVPREKISRISVATDSEKFSFSEKSAARFRNYIQVPKESILVTFITNLGDFEPAATIIQGTRLALNQLSAGERSKVRLLICGSGEASSPLKYLISDLGLGAQTMLLAQDTAPFLHDLLCASDIIIEGRRTKSENPEILPWHLVSAATCGASIIVPSGTIADDWLSGLVVSRLDDFSAMDVALTLTRSIGNVDHDAERRKIVGSLAAQSLSPTRAANTIAGKLETLCQQDELSNRRQGLRTFIEGHQVVMTYKDASDVLVKCEEVREFASTCEVGQHSEVLRIRGDALATLSRGDEAVSAFEESLKANSENYHALRGLGYLAWQGHSHEDALRFFKRGLAVNPNDYQCLVGIALVYRRLKMFLESVFWLQKAIGIGGLESPSLNLMVQACLENSSEPEALEVLVEIRDTFGEHPNLSTAIEKIQSHQ